MTPGAAEMFLQLQLLSGITRSREFPAGTQATVFGRCRALSLQPPSVVACHGSVQFPILGSSHPDTRPERLHAWDQGQMNKDGQSCLPASFFPCRAPRCSCVSDPAKRCFQRAWTTLPRGFVKPVTDCTWWVHIFKGKPEADAEAGSWWVCWGVIRGWWKEKTTLLVELWLIATFFRLLGPDHPFKELLNSP